MKQLVALAPLLALAACGSADDRKAPQAATTGEVQSLLDAEAMLESRESEAVEDDEAEATE